MVRIGLQQFIWKPIHEQKPMKSDEDVREKRTLDVRAGVVLPSKCHPLPSRESRRTIGSMLESLNRD